MTFNLSYISDPTSKVLGLQVGSNMLSLWSAENQIQKLMYARQLYPQFSTIITSEVVVVYSKIDLSSAFIHCIVHFQMTINWRYLFHRAHLHPQLHTVNAVFTSCSEHYGGVRVSFTLLRLTWLGSSSCHIRLVRWLHKFLLNLNWANTDFIISLHG